MTVSDGRRRFDLDPPSFGDSDKAQVGDVVLAVGNPLGLSTGG
jgi:S1-C subfamily serine protease